MHIFSSCYHQLLFTELWMGLGFGVGLMLIVAGFVFQFWTTCGLDLFR
jgi:hypothetical protein